MTAAIGPVPATCRRRLIGHYGSAPEQWLDSVPGLFAEVAGRWGLRLGDYHDAGHASVVALARRSGQQVLLKAWFDDDRYARELAALHLWHSGPAVQVLDRADDMKIALLDLVGGAAGGRARPKAEAPTVASAIAAIHAAARRPVPGLMPDLTDYCENEVFPRIRHRMITLGSAVPTDCLEVGLGACEALPATAAHEVVLHADLYRENVLWDAHRRPVLIDPLPMIGDAAFDWAFWTVYYDLAGGQRDRLRLAENVGQTDVSTVQIWAQVLSLDGLLFYLETQDPRVARMIQVLRELAEMSPTAAPP